MLGSYNIIQCHITAITLGMFYGAKYTHHPFTQIIKQQIKTATANTGVKRHWSINTLEIQPILKATHYHIKKKKKKLPFYEPT